MFYSEETKHKLISGGFAKNKHKMLRINKDVKICTECVAKKHILDMVLKWNSFMKLNKKSKKRMCQVVSDIFGIPSNDYPILLSVLKKIYKTPNENIVMQFITSRKIFASVGLAGKELFFTWLQIIETLLLKYLKGREKKITNDKSNNIAKINKKWDEICQRYSINSSSRLLLFNGKYHKTRPLYIENTIMAPRMSFKIHGIRESNVFENAIRKFTYMGYCPCEPLLRLNALFKFPIKELISAMEAIQIKVPNFGKLFDSISSIDFEELVPKKVPVYKRKTIKKSDDEMVSYVENILNIYMKLKDTIVSYEKSFDNIAKFLIKYTDIIKKWKENNL